MYIRIPASSLNKISSFIVSRNQFQSQKGVLLFLTLQFANYFCFKEKSKQQVLHIGAIANIKLRYYFLFIHFSGKFEYLISSNKQMTFIKKDGPFEILASYNHIDMVCGAWRPVNVTPDSTFKLPFNVVVKYQDLKWPNYMSY